MKRSEVIPAVVSVLTTAFPGAPIVSDDFTAGAASTMETALRTSGVCWAVMPILATTSAGQAGKRSAEKAACRVHLRVNRAVATTYDTYTAQDTAIDAILADRSMRAELSQAATDLVVEDAGNLTHAINFTVTIN